MGTYVPPHVSRRPILQPGRNCWRVEPAHRVSFLVDGEAYFGAVRAALERAEHVVYILGWDIDSRILLQGNGERDGYPATLGDFLNELVRRRHQLHIYVLIWDFAMIYALEREWLPIYKLGWKSHRRIHFRMDGRHPPGGSQHQKIVAIDDSVAFLGGMDLSKWRWDTSDHHPVDPRRYGPEGHLYPPYHDVQVAVSGPAAKALGELARERWHRVSGEHLPPPPPVREEPWPEQLIPDVQHGRVALARTFPRYADWDEVREVERLFIDSIHAARNCIYIENQYFTSRRVAEALAERLAEPDGPEVVLVLPKHSTGWLEQATMDVLRARTLAGLRIADKHGRLAVFYPDHPAVHPEYINVHDKVMIIDDDFVRVGSANLSNRSMGLDSECDLAMEAAGDPMLSAVIAGFRDRLLAEHLETRPEIVARVFQREHSLLRTVSVLRRRGRSLLELPPVESEAPLWATDVELIDPEHPVAAETLVERLVEEDERRPTRYRLWINIALLVSLLALAAAWRWTPLREWLDVERLFGALAIVRDMPAAPLLVLATFVLGGLVVLPLTLLIVVTVLAFGPVYGFVYSLTGALLSAFCTYGVGHWLGRDTVRRFAGKRVNRLSQRLAQRGVLAMMVVRVLPIAPFSVVNVVAGASHIRFPDFVLGTLLGLLPGLLAMTVFIDRIAASLKNPQPLNWALLAVVTAVIAFAAWSLQRLLRRRRAQASEDMPRGPMRE